MSNVNPGDIARFIRSDVADNINRQVLVIGKALRSRSTALMIEKYGAEVWECEALQPLNSWNFAKQCAETVPAGSIIRVTDAFLRRVDPPADAEDLYTTTKLPGERVVESIRGPRIVFKEKL